MNTRIANCELRMKRGGKPVANVGVFRASFLASWVRSAFTILEVMVACAIFFMVAFAILELVTRSLIAVRAIQKRDPDPGIILASLSLSNKLEEGNMSGNFEDIAPNMYPGHRWEAQIVEIGTNGLFQIDVFTYSERQKSKNPVLISGQFFRPMSPPGSVSKGGRF